jgi:phosphatidylcholine synthase
MWRDEPPAFPRTMRNVSAPSEPVMARALALAVHLFTASGAVLGFLALRAAAERQWVAMFVWLSLALIVDGLDGTLARRFEVKRVLPRYSGEILDLVIDYLTYVVVPAYALTTGGLLPTGFDLLGAGIILVSSALYFADGEMKTSEGGFRGFPATWNVVVFLVFVFDPGPWLVAATIGVLAVLTFVPIVMIHPVRVRRFRPLSLAMLVAWGLAAILALRAGLEPAWWIKAILAVTSLYFLTIGLVFGRARPAN